MLSDIKNGMVNCVIVKDLSRLGREHVDTSRYLRQIFPAFGVRFIAVTDHIDSEDEHTGDDLVVSIKSILNDNYCRDTSIKIRSHLDVRRCSGKFIGSFAAYGYRKDPEDKNHLLIDDEAAAVVVVGEFYDFAPGCALGRPGLDNLLKSMGSGIAEGVMVKDLSRLARDRDVAEQVQSRIRKADCCLLSVDSPLCKGGQSNG